MHLRYILSLGLITALMILSFEATSENKYNKPINAKFEHLTPEAKRQVECLAENIYFESAHEPEKGKIAVAFVTLNRVESPYFPDDICGVVKEKGRNNRTGKIVCQFSWYCEPKPYYIYANKLLTNGDNPLYNSIKELATHVYVNHEKMVDPSRGSLFYHADYVSPNWRGLQKVTVIGRHIFYVKPEDKI